MLLILLILRNTNHFSMKWKSNFCFSLVLKSLLLSTTTTSLHWWRADARLRTRYIQDNAQHGSCTALPNHGYCCFGAYCPLVSQLQTVRHCYLKYNGITLKMNFEFLFINALKPPNTLCNTVYLPSGVPTLPVGRVRESRF